VLFPLNSLYIFNILFLILGPILLTGLLFVQAVIQAANRRQQENQWAHGASLLTRVFTDFRLMWRWSKFWVAIIVTIGVQAFLVFTFIVANPYVRLRSSHLASADDRLSLDHLFQSIRHLFLPHLCQFYYAHMDNLIRSSAFLA